MSAEPILRSDVAVLERLPHGQLRLRDARSDEPTEWAFCTPVNAEDLPAIFEAAACRGMTDGQRRAAMEGFPW